MQQITAGSPQQTGPRSHDEVLSQYTKLRARLQAQHASLQASQKRLLFAIVATIVLILALTGATLHSKLPAWPMALSFVAFIALTVMLLYLQGRMERLKRLLTFYDTCLARVDGTKPFSDRDGTEPAAAFLVNHLYAHDLDITGPRSLFALLCTVRTSIGERGLARFLLAPTTQPEAVARQNAVRELLPRTELREHITLLGATSMQQLSATFFDKWLDDPAPAFHPFFRYALALTAAIDIVLLALAIVSVTTWGIILPNLLLLLVIQAAIALRIRDRVSPLLESSAKLKTQTRLFAEGVELMQSQAFNSPRLLELQRIAAEPAGAVKQLKRLDSLLLVIQKRASPLYFLLSLFTAGGSQAAISLANWKRLNAPAMRRWLEAWAEFEALNALATYAFEHPSDDENYTWPQLLPTTSPPSFEAKHLAHPLIAAAVANDINLAATNNKQQTTNHFLLISGSNMAGKSTLMRSIGVAAVLAYAGAPVRAAFLGLTPLIVGASIALTDSLAEGKSKFLAEVERLAAIVKASEDAPVLFLVDEIFSGTNSLDRRTAAAAVLARLLRKGAIGALSTHDLALTSLATAEAHGLNVHMASPDAEDPLAFDYILKPGINQQSNALAIIRMLGLTL